MRAKIQQDNEPEAHHNHTKNRRQSHWQRKPTAINQTIKETTSKASRQSTDRHFSIHSIERYASQKHQHELSSTAPSAQGKGLVAGQSAKKATLTGIVNIGS